ncbi:MAG: hypothetical protein Q9217_006424 [Psora testacea]
MAEVAAFQTAVSAIDLLARAKKISKGYKESGYAEASGRTKDERVVVVLQGMGGQGKTQTALEVCKILDPRDSEVSIAQAFERFGQQMVWKNSTFSDRQHKIDFVKEGPSLLVFDNYDDLASFGGIRKYFPSNSNNAVLVHLGESNNVPGTTIDDAISLLLHCSDVEETDEAVWSAEQIVSQSGYLPLTIAQAGAYINTRKVSLHDFFVITVKEQPLYYSRHRRSGSMSSVCSPPGNEHGISFD